MTDNNQQNIIIYNTADGRASVALYARDGNIWLNQQQMAELFATSKSNISMHIAGVLRDRELDKDSVVQNYLTTAADGKNYNVVYYSLEMILASGLPFSLLHSRTKKMGRRGEDRGMKKPLRREATGIHPSAYSLIVIR